MPDQVHKRTMYEHILVIEAHARQLERELNEVTKQRDHYKKSCDQYSEDEMLCKLKDVTKQRDNLKIAITDMMAMPSSYAYKIGKQALEELTTETK